MNLSFLNKNKILNMCQFGFKESTSTCDSLLDFTSYLQTNNDKHYAVVSIDIKKAFDSLDHYILLDKLYLYGFRGLSGDIINSYLTNINQYCHFNSSISSTLPIKYGVPQGSVLGLILFLLFINYLSNIQNPCHFTHFAYDTTIAFSNKNIPDLENIINETLVYIIEWLNNNRL